MTYRRQVYMENRILFNRGIILDNRYFYNEFLNIFYELLFVKKKKYIILDISEIDLIKTEVVPKLCSLAMIAKREGCTIEIIVNPISSVKEFLAELQFFEIASSYDLFCIDDGQTGGSTKKFNGAKALKCFDKESMLKYYNTLIEFPDDMSSFDRLKICIKVEILGMENLNYSGYISENMIKDNSICTVLAQFCCKGAEIRNIEDIDIADIDTKRFFELGSDFVEIIHNSLFYGDGLCFFSVQSGVYKKGAFKRVNICVADSGRGLYDTLKNKDWNKKETKTMSLDKFLSLDLKKDQDYYSILEMIYYRAGDLDRGVYDVMKDLNRKKNVRVNMCNRDLRVLLKDEDVKEIVEKNYRKKYMRFDMPTINYGYSVDISFSS